MAETALVTGATSGIGESLCLLFASDGYNLVTVARDKESLEKQAKDLRLLDVDVEPIACDLSQEGAARKLYEQVRDKGIDVDILVNDAGYSPSGQFADLCVADIRAMLQLCVVNLTELTSVFLHPMIERGNGRILNMSSMMAFAPCPRNALYGASKAFVFSFTNALADELHGTGVTATAACPGATNTNFAKNAGIEGAPAWKHFAMDSDETAIRVYRALMRGERCVVTGWYNKAGAFSTRFMSVDAQMRASEWLMGPRKHPLGGGRRCGCRDGKRDAQDRRDGEQADGKGRDDGKGKQKRYEREHPLGHDGKRGWYDKGREARKSPWGPDARRVTGIHAIFTRQQQSNGEPREGSAPWDRAHASAGDNAREQRLRKTRSMLEQQRGDGSGQPSRKDVRRPSHGGPAARSAATPGSGQPASTGANPCGNGRGWRAATLGCDRYRQQNPQHREQSGGRGAQPTSGMHHGPVRDGVPANLGRFSWRGRFAQ